MKIVMVGQERWSTYGVFNANAYPDGVGDVVTACGTRAAIFLVHMSELKSEVATDRLRFAESLESQRDDLTRALTGHSGPSPVGYFDGLGYLTALYGCLLSLKSFLDVYAQLMAKVILPRTSMTFKRANVGNVDLSGGKFINWLNRSAPSSFGKAAFLADLTKKHSNEWITPCVSYRDTLTHYADLPGIQHMSIRFRTIPPVFDFREIEEPTMPDGTPVVSYCGDILDKLRSYVQQSVVILPNTRQDLISTDSFLIPRN